MHYDNVKFENRSAALFKNQLAFMYSIGTIPLTCAWRSAEFASTHQGSLVLVYVILPDKNADAACIFKKQNGLICRNFWMPSTTSESQPDGCVDPFGAITMRFQQRFKT